MTARRAGPLTWAALAVASLLTAAPVYWMVVVASRTNAEAADVPPPLLPGGHFAENVRRLFANPDAHFARGLLNSVLVSGCVALGTVLLGSLAGFAFAKLRFRGRDALLLTVVATMMVPVQTGVVPLYLIMLRLHWQDGLQAVTVPFLVTGFGVFLMRQAAREIPDALIEAARVDGCTTLAVYRHVVLPALRPTAGVLGLLTFAQTWNDFLWPLVVLSPDDPTVQLSLNNLATAYYNDYALMFAGASVAVLPPLALFALLGPRIVRNVLSGAVKG
ncbi:L-arabinose transport system permease protein AraQ [Actinomadura rubteroloni]|uniref:L-arabinose transport system permease protein AraQ n=1 Tax=Actinomadura rubteroloni TaxID=1926885 RepID=A0A2P4UCY5_9ACTN|nr:carbohydrate ABC transporter permease [Actinomadura rubteroloni]POM22901.1 L-arabinose transport system permease protein AraQ [Actinomadura rubteroloni]